MNIESTKFFKINKIAKIFIMLVLAFCILMNIVDMIKYSEFVSIKHHLFIIVIYQYSLQACIMKIISPQLYF